MRSQFSTKDRHPVSTGFDLDWSYVSESHRRIGGAGDAEKTFDEAFAGVDVIVNALPDGADKETKQAAIRAAARSSAKVYFLDEFGS